MDEISENIFNEELDKLLLVENSIQRKIKSEWVQDGDPMNLGSLKRRTRNTHWLSHSVSLNLEDNNYRKPNQIKLNEREYICVADWGWRIIFIKNAMQEVAEEIEEF